MTQPLTTEQLTRIAFAIDQHIESLRDSATSARKDFEEQTESDLTAEADALQADFAQFVEYHGLSRYGFDHASI